MTRESVNFLGLVAALSLGIVSCGDNGNTPASNGDSGGVQTAKVTTSAGIEMIVLGGGDFSMGSDDGEADEAPAHRVSVLPFVMDVTEVTHAMFEKMQLPNPSKWQDSPDMPVNQVRWRDAKQFCNERSLEEGLTPCYDEQKPGWPCRFEANGYRLPTEAEWEFAARAGDTSPYPFGNTDKLPFFAWFQENSGAKTHPVATRKANAWGFHGLYGNVSEWCQDIYSENYYRQSAANNPTGPVEDGGDHKRVIRGGSWKSSASMCRVTFRQGQPTGDTDACFYTDFCGFRCVRRPTADELAQIGQPAASQ